MTTPSDAKSIESLHVEDISRPERLRRSFWVTLQVHRGSSISFEWGKQEGTDGRLSLQCRALSWSKPIRIIQAGTPISFESVPFKVYMDCGIPRAGLTGGGVAGGDPTRIGYLHLSASEDEGAYFFAKFGVIPKAFEAVVDGIRHERYPIIVLHVFGLDGNSEGCVWSTGDPDLTVRENRRLGFNHSALDVMSASVEIPFPVA